ncbi:MAG: hypothetical protein O3B95_05095 [Chloroflexi bacterium]|nr:hypothetical protein [Chloroflexota bacterium]
MNLTPYFGKGEPVRVRNTKGGPLADESDFLVDWFVQNEGPGSLVGSYFIDIYLDDILAKRWNAGELPPGFFFAEEGVPGLLEIFNLEPGKHVVRLVADSTNRINETSENDNVRESEFTWAGQLAEAPMPDDRLPNLSVITGQNDRAPMIVSPFDGAHESGGLSVHGDTHISLTILNDSPITIDKTFAVHVVFDDIVVHRITLPGLLGGSAQPVKWADLASVKPLTTGEHTLKLVLDPTGAIAESDENDNSFELDLVWGAHFPLAKPDPRPAPEAPARPNQVLVNLAGYVQYGWDAAISVGRTATGLPVGQDSDVWIGESSTISFTVRNNSRVSTSSAAAFRVDVYVDETRYGTQLFSTGGDAGALWTGSVEVPAGSLVAGQHLVRLVLDSDQVIPEGSETDNTVARWVNWLPVAAVVQNTEKFLLSAEQINEMLAPVLGRAFVDQMRPVTGTGFDLPPWISEIKSAGKAGYYLLTGRNLDAERIVAHFLPHDQFIAASLDACMNDYLSMSGSVYTSTYVFCRDFRGEVGFAKRINGKNHVYVDLGESPMQALATYFHELGHALQDLTNPALSVAPRTANLKGLLEAQAQMFEAAALRAIEEHSSIPLMKYPNNPSMKNAVDFSLGNTNSLSGSPEHALGYKMLWMESLTNSSGLDTNTKMLTNTHLSSSTAKGIYDFLVAMQPGEIEPWVKNIFAVSTRADKFMQRSRDRLRNNLPTSDWGNPDLLESAFLAP